MQYKMFLIKYAEIAIKGKNRYLFEDALANQIKYALKKCDGEFQVRKTQGRIYVDAMTDLTLKTRWSICSVYSVFLPSVLLFTWRMKDLKSFARMSLPFWTVYIPTKTRPLRSMPEEPENIIRRIP